MGLNSSEQARLATMSAAVAVDTAASAGTVRRHQANGMVKAAAGAMGREAVTLARQTGMVAAVAVDTAVAAVIVLGMGRAVEAVMG